jgi:uncharacterized protein YcfJ
MLRLAFPCLCLSVAGLLAVPCARAQDAGRETVVPQENVRFDYAQVLEVSPIYQTLRATRMERVCDAKQPSGSGLSKVVSAVKNRLSSSATREEREAGLSNCRMAPVVREYRRPIAFDVDYVYKGSKFRTRLAQDPGNRLRVRVSITPQPMAEP